MNQGILYIKPSKIKKEVKDKKNNNLDIKSSEKRFHKVAKEIESSYFELEDKMKIYHNYYD